MAARVAIVGAGPAGLATAAMLRRQGVESVLLERGERAGESWYHHYATLRLHTVRSLSGLPGLPIPRAAGRWVSRADFAAYLERYAREASCDVRTHTDVQTIHRDGNGYELQTTIGQVSARAVVVATGFARQPVVPDWPGGAEVAVPLVHSSAYRDAAPYRGRRVLVVGAGNSGADIALDLAAGGASAVWLSVRDPFVVVPRQAYGMPAQIAGILLHRLPTAVSDGVAGVERAVAIGSLEAQGLPGRQNPVFSRHRGRAALPLLDHGLVEALRDGRVRRVGAVDGFAGDRALLRGGGVVRPDAVIAATGYRPGLEPLVGELEAGDGLFYCGFRNPITGALRGIGADARAIARQVRELVR